MDSFQNSGYLTTGEAADRRRKHDVTARSCDTWQEITALTLFRKGSDGT